jgi:hypothetical protein
MRIDVPSNFVPMDQFSLRWRWTDPKYRALSGIELALIRPFDAAAAGVAHASAIRVLKAISSTLSGTGVTAVADDESAAMHDASGDPHVVRDWLRHLVSNCNDAVIISWDQSTAVLAPWNLFVERWDDFCYPSSDDVFVFPLTGDWMLCYDHADVFRFRHE